jgi:hypothetical protein
MNITTMKVVANARKLKPEWTFEPKDDTYAIYDKFSNELWQDDSDYTDFSVICESLKDQFVYACRIGDDTKKWVLENFQHDYYFVVRQYSVTSSELGTDTLILVCDETDAMALKLGCI